jgi:predicted phosphodiesterase
MENKINRRTLLLVAMSLIAAACSKESDFVISGESVDLRFKESMEWNEKHPYREINVESDDYSILLMADSHVGGTTNLDKFFNIARTERPVAVLMDGDLTGGLTQDYNVFEEHLPQDDSLSLFYIAGNHDLWYSGWGEYYDRFGSSSYYFTVKTPTGSDLFICLDSGGSTLGNGQMKWLKSLLETMRPLYRRCIVISHTNLFRPRHTESTNPVVEELYDLIELFTENKVDMVITGHDHVKDVEVFGITTYIQVAALEDGLSYAGYMSLHVKNGKAEYKLEVLNEQ